MALARNISARQAATYYEKDDYYTRDRSPSQWHGNGARALGLQGSVDREVFANLVEGRIPDGPTLHRGGGARRGGTDFEFSAPKSFSIQALVNGDKRLLEVHQSAIAIARERIEETIATRITKDGETRMESTRAAVIAQFEHATSRAGDPDLHSHVVVLNVTRRADGQWRSIENSEMFKEQRLMYEIYLSELAKGAKDLGYEIVLGKHDNPELGHITREQIEHFSQRARKVVSALESAGLTRETSTAAQKRAAALSTRDAKKEYDQQALRAEWIERGRQVGLLEFVPAQEGQFRHVLEEEAARQSVQFAIKHLSEREAAFPLRAALVESLKASRTSAGFRMISETLSRRVELGELVQDAGSGWITTQAALESERKLVALEHQGRGKVAAILPAANVNLEIAGSGLNAGQREMVDLILMTQNRVIGVNGLAGTGKTTALATARDIAERHGFIFVGLAPSHSAVAALKKSAIPSQTAQRWLHDDRAHRSLNARSIVVFDEAGLAGTTTLRAVLERVERAGARAVLLGDVHQYQSVEAGRGFAQLQESGMATAQLTEMVRQRDARLAEAARASVDEPKRALGLLPVIEEKDAAARYQNIAQRFGALSAQERAQMLILAGTHEARREINARIRSQLQFSGSGEYLHVFRTFDKTAAEKRELSSYRPGLAIRFEKHYRSLGAKRGDTAHVERVVGDAVVIRLYDGTRRTMSPPRLSGKGWSVGEVESLEICTGEGIRFTGTNPASGYRNGERGVIAEIRQGSVLVRQDDGRTVQLSRDRPASVDYSYAVTGHSAQGLDAKHVILEKDTQSRTTNHRSFYTDVTRARETAVVATNSIQQLSRLVTSSSQKTAAMDVSAVMANKPPQCEREHG